MVKNSVTTKQVPPDTAAAPTPSPAGDSKDTVRLFNSAAIGMSWQLAVVVLVPILGGYKLDEQQHSSPLWTLVGLALAMAGMIVVIRRALNEFNEMTSKDDKTKESTK